MILSLASALVIVISVVLARVPEVGRVTEVVLVAIKVIEKFPEVTRAAEALLGIVKVPAVAVTVRPLRVLLVNASDPAKVARVPVVGKVTLVDPVVVKVRALFPEVVKLLAVVILPPIFRVRETLITSNVKVLPAVKAVEEVAAKVKSKAAEVSLNPNPVIPARVPEVTFPKAAVKSESWATLILFEKIEASAI